MKNKFYVTAAIPYVNGAPHIGHALEFIEADVVARYQRLLCKDVFYLCGSDENGLKMVQSAEKENIPVKDFCSRNAEKFETLFHKLNCSLDHFERASSPSHQEGSQKLWNLCRIHGDLYKKNYQGYYCVGCESFLTEKDLVDGKCPEHQKAPEIVSEENYFFKLSKYQTQILDLLENKKVKIFPETRRHEIITFIKEGLEDFSVSRSFERARGWGVTVPDDPSQIIYIWFDALNIYQTGLGFMENSVNYQQYWPADVHVIGKGIIRFHAVYWLAILLSANLPLPKEIFVHGYVNVHGQKMSKSLGNVVDPFIEIEKHGVDPLRYYLLSQIPAYEDGDYNETLFQKVYNSDLANGLGNTVSRVAKLCEKSALRFESSKVKFKDLKGEKDYHKALETYCFDAAIKIIWEKLKKLDQKIDADKAWELLKNKAPSPKLKTMLFAYVDEIRQIACLLKPFLPDTASRIEKQFSGTSIISEKGLFMRLS